MIIKVSLESDDLQKKYLLAQNIIVVGKLVFLVAKGDVALAMLETDLAGNKMAVRHECPSNVERGAVVVAASSDSSVRLIFPTGAHPAKATLVARVGENVVLASGVFLSTERYVALSPRCADLAGRHTSADVTSGDVQDFAGVLGAADHGVGR